MRVRGFAISLGIALAALVVATLAAEALGAANLGTALTFGQIAFLGAILALMLFRD